MLVARRPPPHLVREVPFGGAILEARREELRAARPPFERRPRVAAETDLGHRREHVLS